jgi:hypothetical protein
VMGNARGEGAEILGWRRSFQRAHPLLADAASIAPAGQSLLGRGWGSKENVRYLLTEKVLFSITEECFA